MEFPPEIKKAIELLSQLPSIGPRAAERIVLKLLKNGRPKISELAEALKEIEHCGFCSRCFNLSSQKLCPICADASRDQKTICVVEDVLDLMAIEKRGIYGGLYHVLGGTIRIGQRNNAKMLTVADLVERTKKEETKEVIIATNPTTPGDMTAVYIKEALKNRPHLKITRISRGMPTGGDIEYADPDSIAGSFRGRNSF